MIVLLEKCYHTRSTSELILHRAGWCHSLFVFITACSHLLISTPSSSCLLRQSLHVAITSAFYSTGCPKWWADWCFSMKEPAFLASNLVMFSFPHVYKSLLVSNINRFSILWATSLCRSHYSSYTSPPFLSPLYMPGISHYAPWCLHWFHTYLFLN